MVRTVTEASLGKKIFSVFVALALVLGMMNLPSYRAFAEETTTATDTVSTTVAAQPEAISQTVATGAEIVEVEEIEAPVVNEPAAEAVSMTLRAVDEPAAPCGADCAHAAAIGDTHYDTVAAAVAAATSGQTVKLLKSDTSLAAHIGVKNKTVTVDLNGKTLSSSGKFGVLAAVGNATIIVKDTVGGGKLVGTNAAGRAMHADSGKNEIILEGGSAEGTTYGVYANTGSTIKINGGSVKASACGIFAAGLGTTVSVNGGTVSGDSYAIWAQLGPNVTVNGGTVTSENIGIIALTNAKASCGTVAINGGLVDAKKIGVNASSYKVNVAGGEIKAPYALGLDTYGSQPNNKPPVYSNQYAASCGTSSLEMTGGFLNATTQVIATNNLNSAGTTATISGGKITAEKTGIYWPAEGNLTVSGTAEIAGGTGIEAKMGTINIQGGTIKGTGAYSEDAPMNGGSAPEGSALLVSAQMYGANANQYVNSPDLAVNISGGKLESANGNAVTVYNTRKNTVKANVEVSGSPVLTGAAGKEAFAVKTAEAGEDVATSASITGGTFSSDVSEFLADGLKLANGVVVSKYCAQVGDQKFETLQSAINAAAEGDTIVMLQDLRESVTIGTGKKIVLDLNGKVLGNNTSGFNNNYTNGAIRLQGGELTLCDSATEKGKLTAPDVQSNEAGNYKGWFFGTGIFVTDGAKLIVDGAIVESDGEAIAGNGSDKSGTSIELKNGAKVISTAYVGIFHPQPGTLTITDSEVSGETGIGIKSGTLTIAGSSKITGNGAAAPNTSTGNGLNTNGAAIQVEARKGYAGNIEISISDNAEITSVNGLAVCQYDATGNKAPAADAFKSLTITGGKFTSGGGYAPVLTADATNAAQKVSISGGTFSSEIQGSYIAEGAGFHEGAVHVHEAVAIEAVAATCTATGLTAGSKCSVCDEILEAQEATEAHAPAKHEAVAATCTTDGTIEYWACSVAQKMFADEAATKELTDEEIVVPATGHKYEWVTIAEPTTEAAGSKHEVCSICGDAKPAVEIEKLAAPVTESAQSPATPVAPIAPAVAPQADAAADANASANDGDAAAPAAAPAAQEGDAAQATAQQTEDEAEPAAEQNINEDETPLATAQVQGKNIAEDGFPVLPVAAGAIALLVAFGAFALRRKAQN